ncbi:MAG: alpha-glucosidase C-terminal domain-containing protein [Deltaproteobacteria bacterium]|nr:alpha-glucosidase C-terminal domain-containing protein [Deltaproteobacteria bacterium]
MVKHEDIDDIKALLIKIYGEKQGTEAFNRILPKIEAFPARKATPGGYYSQQDVILITYGDSLLKKGDMPLAAFEDIAKRHLKDIIPTIHFLPFFPFSSDDGFSVMDYYAVNPELGTWENVKSIAKDFRLMFDFVINHYSSKSEWFKNYLEEKEGFKEFAIEVDPSVDLSLVIRPRSHPLLTEFKKKNGKTVHVWTTFSADQIDFNYRSLDVFEKIVEILLFYVKQGACLLRLDAVGFLWKEIGTTCMHLPQTHNMVKVFRKILDVVAPDVILVTETNVPHEENISYFGNGQDEAQMVYNFPLPSLLFYTFLKEDATVFSKWAKGLHLPSDYTTFINFTASHDGIGLRPLEGILSQEEINRMIDIVKANGGHISYRVKPDGSQTPYELNITYVDAILADINSDRAEKFLASQAVQYVLPGVPATYIHSLLGSRNWTEGVKQTGQPRTINREKLYSEDVLSELRNPESFRSRIFFPYVEMIKTRRKQPAFHPNAGFEILDIDRKVFAIKRFSEEQTIYALTNISSEPVSISLSNYGCCSQTVDVLSGKKFDADSIKIKPYQYIWLSNIEKLSLKPTGDCLH